jgi:formate dehydrogenase maturation protein FdhE
MRHYVTYPGQSKEIPSGLDTKLQLPSIAAMAYAHGQLNRTFISKRTNTYPGEARRVARRAKASLRGSCPVCGSLAVDGVICTLCQTAGRKAGA